MPDRSASPLRRLLVSVALLAAGASLLGANCNPTTRATLVASGLSAPNFLTAPLDDPRLFVVELTGLIKIVENGVVRAIPFLDLRAKIGSGGEQGLLGLAFPPDFEDTRQFYVYYIDVAGDSVLSRFLVSSSNPNLAVPSSERIVLRIDQPAGRTTHKGGTIAFSPVDGMLYWALGDGGGNSDPDNLAQNGQSLLGKMLRLDVGGGPTSTYTIPPDNPFVGGDGVRDEIWAFGFRNPFRFSFDSVTGDLWVGDVGQGQREEVDFEASGDPGGRNYGWKIHEGTLCYLPQPGLPCESPSAPNRFTFPIHEYATHQNGTCAITGGVVYRGRRIASLVGAYVYSDYCSDRVEARRPDGSVLNLSAAMVNAEAIDGVVAIGEDGFGELYLVSLDSGQIHKLE